MPSYIQKRRKKYYGVLEIPKDVRPYFDDKPRFVKSLDTDSETVALRRVAPLVAQWKGQIQTARQTSFDPLEQDIQFWKSALADASPHSEVGDESQRDLLLSEIYTVASKVEKPRREEFVKRITGQMTPTKEHLEEWLGTLENTAKTVDMKKTDVERLSKKFTVLEHIHKRDVQRWANQLIGEEELKSKTVTRILSACRGYWRYLQAIQVVNEETFPFDNLQIKNSKTTEKKDQRKPFTPEAIISLLNAAKKNKDDKLAYLIEIGMWTGARIEEICSLRTSSVHDDYLEIEDAKTAAGWRQVPVHSQLKPLITKLKEESKDGYIISGLTFNKYNDRSNAIGKRFGTLKSSEGFGKQHVFHSIRKTVATQFENAGVLENEAADIIGHEKNTMTYGLYSGGLGLEQKKIVIEKLQYPQALN
ncbi:tyrosine-type recombinase/integrase [Curvivirga sp.]|uniref:tyrosine-type recombinase/integrase n=1 Tax=Curvivirga sp. TaxID=2856848 RepID=UPI003B58ECD3